MTKRPPARGGARAPATAVPPSSPVAPDEASQSFVKGLVERGEAVVPDGSGALPSGATHEIVGTDPDGTAIVRRRRFSSY